MEPYGSIQFRTDPNCSIYGFVQVRYSGLVTLAWFTHPTIRVTCVTVSNKMSVSNIWKLGGGGILTKTMEFGTVPPATPGPKNLARGVAEEWHAVHGLGS